MNYPLNPIQSPKSRVAFLMAGHPLEGVDREERVVTSDGIGATVGRPEGSRAKQRGVAAGDAWETMKNP